MACEKTYAPKPACYPRIYYPERVYNMFDSAQCNFSFEKPVYALMTKDPRYTYGGPCWYNMVFKPFNATLHLSYHEFYTDKAFDSLFEDTRKMVYKHIVRADDIEEIEVESNNENFSGLIFRLKGNTATNFNFYLSDNKQKYLRGALYFNEKTNPDSVAPVLAFMVEDIMHMVKTFKWN